MEKKVNSLNRMQNLATHSQRTSLNPECIRVLNWNIQKQSRPALRLDLEAFSRDVDLVLLQEVHVEHDHFHQLTSGWHHCFAPGYVSAKKTTGVMTLANVQHRTHDPLVHPEPLLRTPKATNMTTYALDGCDDTLLVINLHAVNFSLGMRGYRRQLEQIIPSVERHRGPVIFAGDFNAWHDTRKRLVQEMAASTGLVEVTFEEDNRSHFFGRHLDYVFVRDLVVDEALSHHSMGSDHNPMLVTVRL